MDTSLKNFILSRVQNLPTGLNYYASILNTKAERVFGKKYENYLADLKAQEGTHYDTFARLLSVIEHAKLHVPYYKNLYGHKSINDIEYFKVYFGFTDKNLVLNNFDEFKSNSLLLNEYDVATTGGTSGKPLQLYVPKDRYVSEWATVHHAWSRVGFEFHNRAVLRNHKLPTDRTYLINPITKEVLFDNFRLSDEYMHEIYKVLKRLKIKFVHAYPSAAYQFSTFCFNNSLDLSFIKAFLSSSENIYPHQTTFIKEKVGTRLFGFYGHTEKLLFGAYCEHTDYFHMEPSYGFFELIDQEGNPVTTPGEIGEMVGTTLNNLGMPLIRYRTGDYAEYLGEECPKCGRKMPILKKIFGRWDGDKIYNRDGSSVTTTALNLHSDIYTVINGLQYYQKAKGELEVLVIKGSGYTKAFEDRLYSDLSNKLAFDTKIKIEYVNELLYNKNGKFLLLKSEV